MPPWETLKRGTVPTYRYDEAHGTHGSGTRIVVDGFIAKQREFKTLDSLIQYIRWYTVLGSFGEYFDRSRTMDVDIQPTDSYTPVRVPFGFRFPDEQTDLGGGTDNTCKLIGPITKECGQAEDGQIVTVQFVGAILGEAHRNIVPHTYTQMGLWLCKDFIRIERDNTILEDVFGGQYYYRSVLLFANCQALDLTANRNDIRKDQEEYDLAVAGIKDICDQIRQDQFVKSYFAAKKRNDEAEKRRKDEEQARRDKERREAAKKASREKRLNRYRARPTLESPNIENAPIKEPCNEAETALLLQAMISSRHPGIDFVVGDYNTHSGVDMIIEITDKDVESIKFAELVFSLDKLFAWRHPPDGYHVVVCYELGGVGENQEFEDGRGAKLVKKQVAGRYALMVGSDAIDVYVLREILQARP